ncbi:MAG: hypothetical protein JEZ02_01400 [Desulfatibacillum sp.]|nr:hypothetical protein [Desulfatibacillum sp.]
MPLLFVLGILVQVTFAIHAIKNGKDRYWIFIIMCFPLLGCLVYFLVEMLPDMHHSRAAKDIGQAVIKTVDPSRDLRQAREKFEFTPTFNNSKALGDELVKSGLHEEAIQTYRSCLCGPHLKEPYCLFALAQSYFATEKFLEALDCLETLGDTRPDYKPAEAHLLYCRALELSGNENKALNEYETLSRHYPGEEARCRYALLLKKNGHVHQARDVFQRVLVEAKMAPKYYRSSQKDWISMARQNLS